MTDRSNGVNGERKMSHRGRVNQMKMKSQKTNHRLQKRISGQQNVYKSRRYLRISKQKVIKMALMILKSLLNFKHSQLKIKKKNQKRAMILQTNNQISLQIKTRIGGGEIRKKIIMRMTVSKTLMMVNKKRATTNGKLLEEKLAKMKKKMMKVLKICKALKKNK